MVGNLFDVSTAVVNLTVTGVCRPPSEDDLSEVETASVYCVMACNDDGVITIVLS